MRPPESARAPGLAPERLAKSDAEWRLDAGIVAPPATACNAPSLLLTRQGLARELRCSARAVDRLRARGLLPAPIRLGGSRSPRWRREDVERWLREVRP